MTDLELLLTCLAIIAVGIILFVLTGFIGELVSRTASERNTYLIDKQTNL